MVRRGADAADLDREKFECQFEASKTVASAGTQGAVAETKRNELESLCMEARGGRGRGAADPSCPMVGTTRPAFYESREVMWTLILVTVVFSGSVAGGVAGNTAFLDFPNEAKCRAAAGAMEASERVSITAARPGQANISPPAYYRIIARCVER